MPGSQVLFWGCIPVLPLPPSPHRGLSPSPMSPAPTSTALATPPTLPSGVSTVAAPLPAPSPSPELWVPGPSPSQRGALPSRHRSPPAAEGPVPGWRGRPGRSDFASQESPGRLGRIVQPATAPGRRPVRPVGVRSQSPPYQLRRRAVLRSRERPPFPAYPPPPPRRPAAAPGRGGGEWGRTDRRTGRHRGCQRAPGAALQMRRDQPGGGGAAPGPRREGR